MDADPYLNSSIATGLHIQASEHTRLHYFFLAMIDHQEKLVNEHLLRRAQQEASKADFFNVLADWFYEQ